MVDIIDVMLAKAMTPQGQIDTYAAKAQQAVQNANAAVSSAETAVSNIESITEQTNTNNQNAAAASETFDSLVSQVDSKIDEIDAAIASITDTTDEFDFTKETTDTSTSVSNNIIIDYPSGKQDVVNGVAVYYKSTGNNEDGTMTQAAITAAINAIPSGGGSIDLGEENAGNLVSVDDDGSPISSGVTEEEVINALIQTGTYNPREALGLQIDYVNKTFVRLYGAKDLGTAAIDESVYPLYNRRRCNVDKDGTILCFWGESNYKEDGSNGAVMVYQPKFYYRRTPLATITTSAGVTQVSKEVIIITSKEQPGFKLHPLFKDYNGNEIDYVLLSAYEGCGKFSDDTYSLDDTGDPDCIGSIAGALPLSAKTHNWTREDALEACASYRANDRCYWSATTLEYESAEQMLMMVDFGKMNAQEALELGVSSLESSTSNIAVITGSTSALGATTGAAASSVSNGTTYSVAGKRAVSYRGVENPWGNMWRIVSNAVAVGEGAQGGGRIAVNNVVTNLQLPSVYGWVSAMGYDEDNDWIYVPASCSGGNSSVPVGDNLWTTANLNATNNVLVGGTWSFKESDGPFYYACDKNSADVMGISTGVRLMGRPFYNAANYASNIEKYNAIINVSQ